MATSRRTLLVLRFSLKPLTTTRLRSNGALYSRKRLRSSRTWRCRGRSGCQLQLSPPSHSRFPVHVATILRTWPPNDPDPLPPRSFPVQVHAFVCLSICLMKRKGDSCHIGPDGSPARQSCAVFPCCAMD